MTLTRFSYLRVTVLNVQVKLVRVVLSDTHFHPLTLNSKKKAVIHGSTKDTNSIRRTGICNKILSISLLLSVTVCQHCRIENTCNLT